MSALYTVNRSTPRLVSILGPRIDAFALGSASLLWSQAPSAHETYPVARLLLENRKADSEFARSMPLRNNQSLHRMTIIRSSPTPRAMMEAPPFSCRNFKHPPLICNPAKQAKKCLGPRRLLPRSGRSFIKIRQRVQLYDLLVSTSEMPRLSRGSHCHQTA